MTHLRKVELGLVGSFVVVGICASLMVQWQARSRLGKQDESMRQQSNRTAELSEEHERLSNLLAVLKPSPRTNMSAELQRLRTETEGLREKVRDLQKNRHLSSWLDIQQTPKVSHPPEYWPQLHERAGSKPKDAVILAGALTSYASAHQGQFPSSLDEVVGRLPKEPGLSGTNEFEIVYHGTWDQITNIPLPSVALIRDRHTWQAPSGKMARVYGMVGGVGQIVESDDNFEAWEAEHIVVPSPTSQ